MRCIAWRIVTLVLVLLHSLTNSAYRYLIATLIMVGLAGCAGSMNDDLGKRAYQAWTKDPQATPDFFQRAGEMDRDTFIFRMKAVKDFEYDNYVLNLRRGTSWGEFGSDSVKIILDSLVAVTGNAGTKAALGAASAGVTGATASVKKNVLFDQTITTFITRMDALRLTKWNDILCKMGRGKASDCQASRPYTIAEAFDDLQEYGHEGTLDAALRGIDKDAAAAKADAKAKNDQLSGGIQKLKPLSEGF